MHSYTQAEDMASKLQDIMQQTLTEITAGCNECDSSLISITMGVFRCFPGSESAVTYRALLHETYQISSLELQQIIARWISSGRAIVVQSLVLRAEQSCPVVVSNVNDVECMIGSPPSDSESTSNTVAVVVGGVSGATLGVVVLIGLIIIIIIITIVKHKQTMVKLKYETRYANIFLQQH